MRAACMNVKGTGIDLENNISLRNNNVWDSINVFVYFTFTLCSGGRELQRNKQKEKINGWWI